jgi:hypothetical protein
MRAKLTLFAMSMCVAMAQDTSVARVFQLHHVETEQDLQEFATVIRTMADLPQVSVDTVGKSIALRGTPTQVAIAEYLFTELDRQTLPDFASEVFRVPNNEDDVVRVFILRHAATIQSFREVATTIRTVAEIRRVFTYNTPRALAVRGTADEIAATEFLVRELDQPADAKRTDSRVYQMIDTTWRPEPDLRVFYLPYTSTVQQFQEIATLVRTIAETRRLFTYNASRALIVRGTPDEVALTGWIVHELGKPVTAGTASQTYQYQGGDRLGENLVRVFYVKGAPTVPAFQQLATQIRMETKMRRVFTCNESMALTLRGTEAQLAVAEQMLKDRQIASK